MVIANILFLASKFERKLKNFGKEIFGKKRKFTGRRRNFSIAVVEALAATQRVENDDAGKNYDPSSFKNSCSGTKTSDHIESDSVKAFHDALNDGLRVLGNDDIVLKEEQYEALLAVAVHRKDCLVV